MLYKLLEDIISEQTLNMVSLMLKQSFFVKIATHLVE